ncbi:phosphate ABC transporter substrate-binding protein PstS [Mariniluteicoccus endophyticus]
MLASPDNGVPVLTSDTARRRRLWMPLFIAAVVGVLVMLLVGTTSTGPIVGSGSTLAQPLIERSAVSYRYAASADNPARPRQTGGDWVLDGSGVEYEPVGSMGGIMRLSNPDVDFAVSDYPLSAQALGELKAVQFPIAIGSVALAHNLDVDIQLDAATTAKVFLGTIRRWNDPAIAQLNPGVQLPDLEIAPVHRSDGSGSTFGLTRWLAASSPEWAQGPGAGSLVKWPDGVGTAAERSGGVLRAVADKKGALTYAEPGQARRAGLKVVRIGSGDRGALPDTAGMRAALSGMDWSGDGHYVDLQPRADATAAYPMTVAIYAVVRRDHKDRRRTLDYLSYVIEKYDASAEELGYLPLPQEAATAVQAYWAKNLDDKR